MLWSFAHTAALTNHFRFPSQKRVDMCGHLGPCVAHCAPFNHSVPGTPRLDDTTNMFNTLPRRTHTSVVDVHTIGGTEPWGDFVCLLRLRDARLIDTHGKPLFPTNRGGQSQLVRVGAALESGAVIAFHTQVKIVEFQLRILLQSTTLLP